MPALCATPALPIRISPRACQPPGSRGLRSRAVPCSQDISGEVFMHPIRRAALCLAASFALAAGGASAQTKLLRYPDIHKDKVVFSYAGDLWTAPASGGGATRLT